MRGRTRRAEGGGAGKALGERKGGGGVLEGFVSCGLLPAWSQTRTQDLGFQGPALGLPPCIWGLRVSWMSGGQAQGGRGSCWVPRAELPALSPHRPPSASRAWAFSPGGRAASGWPHAFSSPLMSPACLCESVFNKRVARACDTIMEDIESPQLDRRSLTQIICEYNPSPTGRASPGWSVAWDGGGRALPVTEDGGSLDGRGKGGCRGIPVHPGVRPAELG